MNKSMDKIFRFAVPMLAVCNCLTAAIAEPTQVTRVNVNERRACDMPSDEKLRQMISDKRAFYENDAPKMLKIQQLNFELMDALSDETINKAKVNDLHTQISALHAQLEESRFQQSLKRSENMTPEERKKMKLRLAGPPGPMPFLMPGPGPMTFKLDGPPGMGELNFMGPGPHGFGGPPGPPPEFGHGRPPGPPPGFDHDGPPKPTTGPGHRGHT